METGDERMRQKVLKKPVKDSDLFRARDLCERHGIDIVSSVIFGLPGETVETAMATIEMTIKTRVHCMIIHFFMPYPGTELGDEAVKLGAFDGDYDSLTACDHSKLVTKVDGPPELIEAVGHYTFWFLEKPWKYYLTKSFFRAFKSTRLRMKLMRYFLSHLEPGVMPESAYHLPEPEFVQFTIDRLEKAWRERTSGAHAVGSRLSSGHSGAAAPETALAAN